MPGGTEKACAAGMRGRAGGKVKEMQVHGLLAEAHAVRCYSSRLFIF